MLFESIEEWKQARWGRFTASEIFRLAEPKKKGAGLFSDTGMTYIFEKAVEKCTNFNDDEQPETWQMRMGHRDEPLAARHLHWILGEEKPLQYFGHAQPFFQSYGPDAGASPDCILPYGRRIELGADLKCHTPTVYAQLALEIPDEKTLREKKQQVWAQGQFSCMVFDCERWLWCPFCDHYPMAQKMFIVEIKADIDWQFDMKIRLEQAVRLRDEMAETIRKRLK